MWLEYKVQIWYKINVIIPQTQLKKYHSSNLQNSLLASFDAFWATQNFSTMFLAETSELMQLTAAACYTNSSNHRPHVKYMQ